MIVALNILKSYFLCDDEIVRNKYFNILESYFHRNNGHIITDTQIAPNGDIIFTLSNEETFTFERYTLPDNMPISFITGLTDALNSKVNKELGKGLSTHDFTTVLKNKLEGLQNYVHPASHAINEVMGLPDVLNDKVDKVAGKGLSEEDYTTQDRENVSLSSKNLQKEVVDADGNITIIDADFRFTFFINTTGVVNVTIPSATLRAGFVCFFVVVGAGQLNILTDGGGAILNSPDGTLLSNGKRGMLEKKLLTDTFYASGEWEV